MSCPLNNQILFNMTKAEQLREKYDEALEQIAMLALYELASRKVLKQVIKLAEKALEESK